MSITQKEFDEAIIARKSWIKNFFPIYCTDIEEWTRTEIIYFILEGIYIKHIDPFNKKQQTRYYLDLTTYFVLGNGPDFHNNLEAAYLLLETMTKRDNTSYDLEIRKSGATYLGYLSTGKTCTFSSEKDAPSKVITNLACKWYLDYFNRTKEEYNV